MENAKPRKIISWKFAAICGAGALWRLLDQIFSDKGTSFLPTAIYSVFLVAFIYYLIADLRQRKRS